MDSSTDFPSQHPNASITVPTGMSPIELAYQNRLDSMNPAERVARSAAMFQWSRDQIARQLSKEYGEMSDELLKWNVALRLYGNEPQVRIMIEQKIADVSG